MLLTNALIALALTPSLVSAALFPRDSKVKSLDEKGFRKAMEKPETSVVAFVAPWCGHCQRLVPELSKAASSLAPLVPTYAVDCDDDKNKRLCAEQGVKGFPTIKIFPRGKHLNPIPYESERSASAIFKAASLRIANPPKKLYKAAEIQPWVEKSTKKPRALLLTKDSKVPLLWKVLSNKYSGKLDLGTHRDEKGEAASALGVSEGGKGSKVLIYAAGSTDPVLYEGATKMEALSKFFDSVLDGSADLSNVIKKERASDEL
ncbi:disulfide isomerase [Coprinopsis cinerea okayama7|uniref:Disulfide isomerase n=1 Tax=Coprinopsis cinerea (strain Okayama-7 / 130 / ATCC MYA-4618 / FGSC 9003) TaxID=240176 RepID=D6RNH3_COPC7|nr:disulfide isomerase [Coprinopsis cinerea okayama7\|eukprot:XP_002910814.1 disulfide isomerase [Coprinopsis cinerea okayama7\